MKDKIEYIASKRGYVISEDGTFYNSNGDIIGKCIDNNYFIATIRIDKKPKKIKAHRLQAYQKYGNKMFEEGIVVRHLDGNPLNNSWDNIAIGTQSDNMMDIPKQVRIKRAIHAGSFNRKYNVDEIKEFHEIDRSYKKTMEKFNISSKGTLNYILNN